MAWETNAEKLGSDNDRSVSQGSLLPHLLWQWGLFSAIRWLMFQKRRTSLWRGALLLWRAPEEPCGGLSNAPMWICLLGKKKRLRVDKWQRNRKELATILTTGSHLENMIKGVTLGFCYKMWICLRSPPRPCCYSGEWFSYRNPKFLGRKIHPWGSDEV